MSTGKLPTSLSEALASLSSTPTTEESDTLRAQLYEADMAIIGWRQRRVKILQELEARGLPNAPTPGSIRDRILQMLPVYPSSTTLTHVAQTAKTTPQQAWGALSKLMRDGLAMKGASRGRYSRVS